MSDDTGGLDLSAHEEELDPVARAALDLQSDLGQYGSGAAEAHFQAGDSLNMQRFSSGAAMGAVMRDWKVQVRDLESDCARIAGNLDLAQASHDQNEWETRQALQDVPTVGDSGLPGASGAGASGASAYPVNESLLRVGGVLPLTGQAGAPSGGAPG